MESNNKMLQRIYGTASLIKRFKSTFRNVGRAQERDHRKIGKDLELFAIVNLLGWFTTMVT